MKLNKYIALLFLFSAVIVSLATYYSLSNSKNTTVLASKALTSERQIARIERIYSIISNADEGVDYYIFTGNDKYLVPLDSSLARAARPLRLIREDLKTDSILLPSVGPLELSVKEKLNYSEELALARKQSFDSALKMVSSTRGMTLMDTVKARVSRINKRERNERTLFAAQDQIFINKTPLTIIAGELSAFIIILLILLLLNRDMQRRLVSEKLLKESEIRYRTIAQNIGSFIYTCDYYGKITFATPNISSLTGYTPAEIIGKHFTFLVAADFVEPIKQGYYTQFKNKIKEETTEFELVTRTGIRKRVKQDVVIFSPEDMMMGFQCTIHDLSIPNKF